jgi:hypothetical protein
MMRTRRFVGWLSAAVLVVAAASASPSRGGALASISSGGVRLVLAHSAYRAGQSITVKLFNHSGSQILRGQCFVLQRRDGARWVTVTSTHGIRVPCEQTFVIPQPVGARAATDLPLYDDLVPGRYRITLRYEPAHGGPIGPLTGPHVRVVRARLRVLAFDPGPMPTLSEQRILTLAEQAARGDGDPHPTLIQHAAGTRFEAVRLSSGDLVFDWTWSYLIAVRGHFTAGDVSIPPGAKPPTGTVLTLVVDARTGQTTDFGIGNDYPPLAKLGPVTTDLGAAPSAAATHAFS